MITCDCPNAVFLGLYTVCGEPAEYFFRCVLQDGVELTARCVKHCSGEYAQIIDDCDPISLEEFQIALVQET